MPTTTTAWNEFADAFEASLDKKSVPYQQQWQSARRWVDKIIRPKSVADVNNKKAVADFATILIKHGMAASSAASYARILGTALRWGADRDYMFAAVRVPIPKATAKAKVSAPKKKATAKKAA